MTKTYDFVAVGLGPFNLGLACLTDPITELDGLFLERKPEFDWHPGMMLRGTTLQTPFMADLVTMADPTSAYSFLNYLKQCGRLYPFYIRESFFLLREEFNAYCRWACDRLTGIRFGQQVTSITYDPVDAVYLVHSTCVRTGEQSAHRARRIVLGTGTPPYVPASCTGLNGPVVHNSDYLDAKRLLQGLRSITIVGSGQSAAEIYRDLLTDLDLGYRLNWVTRSPRFFPLEYTKLTLELTSPEYCDYFHDLPADRRDALLRSQRNLYKGINGDLIDEIYDELYAASVTREPATTLLTNTSVESADYDDESRLFTLGLRNIEQDSTFVLDTEGLVLATGYAYRTPDFIDPIRHLLRFDDAGRFDVDRRYSVDAQQRVFVQNAEAHTHGFVAPDLGMASYRNSIIIAEMTGTEHYPVERRIAFQEFGEPRSGTMLGARP
ncbi:MAG: lysine N(6)-hydroxylase/L-ornithine N(5)-oxygenase family protein [Nocardioidaceae bacterium]